MLTKDVPIRISGTNGRAVTNASVDSELTMLYRRRTGVQVPVVGFVQNPYFAGATVPGTVEQTAQTVARDSGVLGYYSWGSNDEAGRRPVRDFRFAPGALAGMFVSTDGRTFEEPPASWLPGGDGAPESRFPDGAIAQYRAILTYSPNDPLALNKLAYALAVHQNTPAEALPFAQRATAELSAAMTADPSLANRAEIQKLRQQLSAARTF